MIGEINDLVTSLDADSCLSLDEAEERILEDTRSLATQSGIYQEDIANQEVVFIGDGAAWIWNLSDEHFPIAVEIVDYMHAKSHLYDVVKVAFGETKTESLYCKSDRAEAEGPPPYSPYGFKRI